MGVGLATICPGMHSPDKCPRAAGHPDQMSSWQYVFLTQRLLTHKLIFQIFVNHKKATKPPKITKKNQNTKNRQISLSVLKISISVLQISISVLKNRYLSSKYRYLSSKYWYLSSKYWYLSKSYHLLPTGTIRLPGQNVALQNRDNMSPGTKCRLTEPGQYVSWDKMSPIWTAK